MRALLLDRLPNTATAQKADADRPLNGVKVTDAALVQALLDYGTYDAYYYIRESSHNQKAEEYRVSDRLQALDLGSVEGLRSDAPEALLLFTSSHHIAKFVPFRQYFGHPEWPICGRIHGLSAPSLIPSYAWNYFAEFNAHDAIICTSTAGCAALLNLFASLRRSRSVAGNREPLPIQLPLMHIDGVDVESYSSRAMHKGEGFVILSVGRLTASHKADLRPLVAAFHRSHVLPASATLILAGDDTQGHIAPELERFSMSFRSTRKVVLMPDISAATKLALFGVADVALCMSDTYQETFGVSVLEAMAAGLPVVAPNWDGYRDIVAHGETGFLVKTHVYPDTGLLNATSMLIDPSFVHGQRVIVDMEELMQFLALLGVNRSLSKRMGQMAMQRVQSHFSWPAVVRNLEEFWNEQIIRGRAVRDTPSPRPIGFMDYDRVFHGHCEHWLSPQSSIELRAGADDLIDRALSGELFSPSPIAGFRQEVDQLIVELCRESGPIPFAELIDRVHTSASGASMIATQISRLIKYGLLSLKSETAATPTRKEHEDERDSHFTLRTIGV